MPRSRRFIKSHTCYEVCFRAKETLPLSAHRVIRAIIGSSLARTQRNKEVILCHDIWNGSHPHIIACSRDAADFVGFFGEVEKRITDAIKRLLGLSHLSIWEGRPLIAEIADINCAMDRISYLYSNPSKDNLVDSVEDFPGYSSLTSFKRSNNKLNYEFVEAFPWIRLPSIPKLSSPKISEDQDLRITRVLTKRNREVYPLIRNPNAWMKCFGITGDKEVKETNQAIADMIRAREAAARKKRIENKSPILGRNRLLSQPILMKHKPLKRERKVFVITTIKEIRRRTVEQFKEFCNRCAECYAKWKNGDFSTNWPYGAFKPPLPPLCNLIPAFSRI